jgi:hypothetical protein
MIAKWVFWIKMRFHRCTPLLIGEIDSELIQRCRCGGIRVGFGGPWMERNSFGSTYRIPPMIPEEVWRGDIFFFRNGTTRIVK